MADEWVARLAKLREHCTSGDLGILALDIETEPNLDALDGLPEPEVKTGNLKDPDKIEAKVQAARQAQLDRLALDPHFGRVISCSFAWTEGEDEDSAPICASATVIRATTEGPDVDAANQLEAHLLRDIAGIVAAAGQVVTFNGAGFDVPFLMRRALILRVPGLVLTTHTYQVAQLDSEHVDVMRVLEETQPQGNPLGVPRRLIQYAKWLLGEDQPAEFADKCAYAEWYARGNFDALAAAGEWDAAMTLGLALLLMRERT